MKNRVLFIPLALALIISALLFVFNPHYSAIHEPVKDIPINKDIDEENRTEEIKLLQHEEFIKTFDPALGYVPIERIPIGEARAREIMASFNPSSANSVGLTWNERGPNNIGGRTRAIVVDKTDASGNTVIAGSVGGGIWRTTNFLNASPTWTQMLSMSQNLAISCIAQSPNSSVASDTLYAGTGEGYNNIDARRGLGIYRSVDGGLNWTVLSSTTTGGTNANDFSFIQKIIVTNNGNIYAAASSAIFCNAGGILRSQDKGASWTRVIGTFAGGSCANATDFVGFDLAVSQSGDLWAATQTAATGAGKIWRSPSGATVGNAGTWASVTPAGSWQRIALACSPLTNNRVYALLQGTTSGIGGIRRTDNAGATWNNINNAINWCDQGSSTITDFSRNQAWYDLTLAIKPDDDNTVYAGGVDLMKSTDAGVSWAQATQWAAGCASLPQIHADNHNIVFLPGLPNQFIVTNDGGIYFSPDNGASFSSKNDGYNVTQYYGVAMHPSAGNNYMLAGAQDNGTQAINSASLGSGTSVSGGDGGLPFILQSNPSGTNQITNYTGTSINISTDGTNFYNQGTFATDRFINPADLDNATGIYYCGAAISNIRRLINTAAGAGSSVFANPAVSNGSTSNSFPVAPAGYSVSAIKVDPNTANRLLVAFATASAGGASVVPLLYRIGSANTAPVSTSITLPAALTAGAYISSIDVESGNASHLLITLSNYGVQSVWESTNLGTTWTSLDNNGVNLPDVPVRWGMFIPSGTNVGQSVQSVGGILLGTELGVWSASTLSGATTPWLQNSNGLGNVRVDQIRLRSSDNVIAVATHGRGVFTSQLITGTLPVDFISFKGIPLDNSNKLTWDVANEYHDAGFDIERKYANENSFTRIGNIAATNSNGTNSYGYDDRNIDLSQNQAYYRLKQIDIDGRYKYSEEILIKRRNAGKLINFVSANKSQLLIRTGNKAGVNTLSINLYDVNGRLLVSKFADYHDQYLDISKLSAGIYIVKCKSPQDTEVYSERFVK